MTIKLLNNDNKDAKIPPIMPINKNTA